MSSLLQQSLPPNPQPETAFACDADRPGASSSSSPEKPICAMCKGQLAKYTCPGCSIRTCSAACASAHKTVTGCSGTRDKAKYVAMNEYTWGKMMDDYTFLEEMGRKISEWGREIVKGGYMTGPMNSRGKGSARGRGRAVRGRGGCGPVKTKRDILKMQLESRDIDMELLPFGMERRKANRSSWDHKNQTALLTIEFKFYRPKDPLDPPELRPIPFTFTTHHNDIKKTLLNLITLHLRARENSKTENGYSDWIKSMIIPDTGDTESFTKPHCVMAAQVDTIAQRHFSREQKAYYLLDPTQPLEVLLRHTHFVEFPTIEIWEEFSGPIVNVQGVRQQQEERPVKRRKMNLRAGKAAIAGLLGGYGSEDDEDDKIREDEPINGLVALNDYAESEEDEEGTHDHLIIEGAPNNEDIGDPSDDDADVEVDDTVLLELVQAARGGQEFWGTEGDEVVDWGDMDDGELE